MDRQLKLPLFKEPFQPALTDDVDKPLAKEECPMCQSDLTRLGGCWICLKCGFKECSA